MLECLPAYSSYTIDTLKYVQNSALISIKIANVAFYPNKMFGVLVHMHHTSNITIAHKYDVLVIYAMCETKVLLMSVQGVSSSIEVHGNIGCRNCGIPLYAMFSQHLRFNHWWLIKEAIFLNLHYCHNLDDATWLISCLACRRILNIRIS